MEGQREGGESGRGALLRCALRHRGRAVRCKEGEDAA